MCPGAIPIIISDRIISVKYHAKHTLNSVSEVVEVKKLIECPLDYSLSDRGGIISSGSAVARIDEEKMSVVPKIGEPITFSPREILEFTERDYRISLLLTSKKRLELTKLGHWFEDFSQVLSKQRNQVVLKDMLMQESLLLGGVKAEYALGDKKGPCEPRIYDTGLVIIAPEAGSSMAPQWQPCVGAKRGLIGDITSDYL